MPTFNSTKRGPTSKLGTVLILAFLSAAFATQAPGQEEGPTKITSQNRTGDLPFSSTVGTDLEYVDIASGNLGVKIPITSVPGRGQDYSFGLRYGGQFFVTGTRTNVSTSITYQIWAIEKRPYLGGIGWVDSKSAITYGSVKVECLPDNGSYTYKVFYMYHDASGGKHRLAVQKDNGASCTSTDPQGPDLGADGISANIQTIFTDVGAPVRLADGTVAAITPVKLAPDPGSPSFPTTGATWTDPNGNSLAEGAGVTDTLGRVIVTQQNLTNQILYKVYDSAGVQRTYTVNYAPVTLSTHFNVIGRYNSTITEYNNTQNAITSIVLPNGRSYQFLYESDFGALRQITLPTGAVISYTWATLADSDRTHRYVASRTVTVNGQSHTWNFSRTGSESGGNSITVTVTDPVGNQSVYIVRDGAVRVAKLYQGSATGTPLRQHDITYASGADPWSDPTGMNNYEPAPVGLRPIRITTTLEDGKVSKKEFDYDSFNYTFHDCYGWPCSPPNTYTTTRGNVTEIREYDWGPGAPGPLVRRTTRNYLHTGDANYLARNIVNKVLSETVYDGAGVQKARTEYEYDSTNITPTSGAPQHASGYSSTFLYRGNATKVKKWRNTDGALLTSTYVYDDLGNIRSITDPGTHTTNWAYDDSWANSACLPPSNSQAYVTQATNHLGHRLQLTRFPCTGLVQARKDENDIVAARAGTTFTYDLFGRTLTQVATDGGQVTNAYNDTPPVTVTSTSKITSTLNLVSVAVQDGLGRVTQTKLTSDPEGTVFADTTYDAFGRTKTVSNPYRSTSDPTYGLTQTQYDALGRVTKVIPPDGTSTTNNVSTVYAGPTTTVTDQAGKVRKSETDALGRLIRVWEPNGFIASGTAATGTVSIMGAEQSVQVESCQDCGSYITIWDTGTVTVTVGGFARSVSYGRTSTAASLASALASAFNASSSSPVTATASGGLITFTSKVTGPSGNNYTLAASSTTDQPEYFSMPSFSGVPSGPTLTGGGSVQVGDLSNPHKTRYFYDTLDNLTCVLQLSTDAEPTNCTSPNATWRPRTFTYNSLSQLLTATNPESGAISYTYDSDGNVLTKVAPKPNQTGTLTVTTTYTYDALHRLTGKSYNDGSTATVSYCYDLASCTSFATSNRVGRRLRMTDAAGESSWSYDALGRVIAERRVMYGLARYFYFGYNLDGSLATLTYPSGRIITYAPSAAGRTLSAVDTNGPINYVTGVTYKPHGAVSTLVNGKVTGGFAGVLSALTYNKRLQPVDIMATTGALDLTCTSVTGKFMHFQYGFSLNVADNGNVASITNCLNTNRNQAFTYDELNRLATAQTTSSLWGNSYVYDIWGNLTNMNPVAGKTNYQNLQAAPASVKNQLPGYSYDAAGNMTVNGTATYTYDAENRLSTAAGVTYTYDGDGRRVKKSNGKLYWNNLNGDVLAETDLSGNLTDEFIFFSGKRVARRSSAGAVSFYFADHLGTSRIIASATGSPCYDADLYPYGLEQQVYLNSCPQNYKFTGKERDTESGLDYFVARHYSSSLARFMSPDPTSLKQHRLPNPTRLNLYSYVANNPLIYVDPDGNDLRYAPGVDPGRREGKKLRDALVRAYRRPSARARIDKMEASQQTWDVGTKKYPTDPKTGETKGGETGFSKAIGTLDPKRPNAAKSIDEKKSTFEMLIDVSKPKDTVDQSTHHELRHGEQHVDDPLGMYNQDVDGTRQGFEEDAKKEGEKGAKEKPDMSQEEAEKKIDEIMTPRKE